MCTGNEGNNELLEVFNRLIKCIELKQIEARYHDKCWIQFFFNQSTGSSFRLKRATCELIQECITLKKCEFLE